MHQYTDTQILTALGIVAIGFTIIGFIAGYAICSVVALGKELSKEEPLTDL
jgi:uncharacterized membrane protein (Fun14 family)